MSADLFAEFNNLSQNPPSQEPSPGRQPSQPQAQGWTQDPFGLGHSNSSSNPLPTPHLVQQWWPSQPQSSGINPWAQPPAVTDQAAGDDDDGWGDFEVPESVPPPATMKTRVPTMELMTSNLVDVGRPPPPGSASGSLWPPAQTTPRPRVGAAPGDPSVLFDADDFELQGGEDGEDGGDEFGDFEFAAQPTPQPQSAPMSSFNQPSMDLLGLDDPPPLPPQQSSQRQPLDSALGTLSFGASSSSRTPAPQAPVRDRTPFPGLSVKTSTDTGPGTKDKPDSPATAWPSAASGDEAQVAKDEDDDGWAEWDDVPEADAYSNKDTDGTQPPASWDLDAVDGSKPSAAELNDKDPPPTNVPPPSVILSLFPDLFNTGDPLLKAIAGQGSSVKQQVLSNPKAVQFLQGYILLGTTAARVIAGRKHRWHRDKMLAKSMSISAAGSKGMKLAGVDKTQSAREDREAADVVTAWRHHVGRLRAAVATANTSGGASLKVPEVGDKMYISTAKLVPTARTPCVICGLRREERLAKVDYGVEDSFGEWWVEHWGHRACKNFWIEHEQRLRQR